MFVGGNTENKNKSDPFVILFGRDRFLRIAIVTERSAFMNRLRFLRLEFSAKKRTQGGENRGKSRQRERKQTEV